MALPFFWRTLFLSVYSIKQKRFKKPKDQNLGLNKIAHDDKIMIVLAENHRLRQKITKLERESC